MYSNALFLHLTPTPFGTIFRHESRKHMLIIPFLLGEQMEPLIASPDKYHEQELPTRTPVDPKVYDIDTPSDHNLALGMTFWKRNNYAAHWALIVLFWL